MKKATTKQVTVNHKRTSAWARIRPASQIVKPYTGVIRHVGTAY